MSGRKTILRVDATYDLMVKVGDRVRRGQRLSHGPSPQVRSAAPAAGVIESIQFDPERHEFVVAIAPAT